MLALPPEKSEDEVASSDEQNDIDVCSGWRQQSALSLPSLHMVKEVGWLALAH